MRRVLFALLVVAGLLSVVVGASIAFVNPRIGHQSPSISISTYGFIRSGCEEPKSNGDVSLKYVDETGYLPIIAGAGLLSVAFLGRQRKKTTSLFD